MVAGKWASEDGQYHTFQHHYWLQLFSFNVTLQVRLDLLLAEISQSLGSKQILNIKYMQEQQASAKQMKLYVDCDKQWITWVQQDSGVRRLKVAPRRQELHENLVTTFALSAGFWYHQRPHQLTFNCIVTSGKSSSWVPTGITPCEMWWI